MDPLLGGLTANPPKRAACTAASGDTEPLLPAGGNLGPELSRCGPVSETERWGGRRRVSME